MDVYYVCGVSVSTISTAPSVDSVPAMNGFNGFICTPVTKPGLETSDMRKGQEVLVGGGSWVS